MNQYNPYEILEIPEGTTDPEVIKKAFRKKSLETHPDRNLGDPNAKDNFQKVTEAYETLTGKNQKSSHNSFEDDFGNSPFFDDILNNFFGGSRKAQQQQFRKDYHTSCTLSFLDAAFGKEIEVNIDLDKTCSSCKGERGSTKQCNTCKGAGVIRMKSGNFTVQTTCSSCGGNGKIVDISCVTCQGKGTIKEPITYKVNLPAGIDDKSKLRLREKECDIILYVSVTPHNLFQREGDDLIIFCPINYGTALLGGTIEIATLAGKQEINIAPKTKTGDNLRLKGKGFKNINHGNTGDMLVMFEIDFYGENEAEVVKLVEKLSKLENKYLSKKRQKFDENVKNVGL